jgi:hypothetical protein
MPSMNEHPSNTRVKILNASDSGSGKTGALASLIDAGFNVRILDFDKGLSVLRGFVKDRAKLSNVHYVEGLQDNFMLAGGRLGIKKACAFQRAMDALEKGGQEYWGADIPPIQQWTDRDILVLDTLSSCGRAALWLVMQVNVAGMKNPEIQHYGVAMENVERMLDLLISDLAPCHVIVNTHITSVDGDARLYPEALGSKLPPKVGRKFDNIVSLRLTAGKRQFETVKSGLLPLKTSVPLKEMYPIDTGWVDIFEGPTGKSVQEILA